MDRCSPWSVFGCCNRRSRQSAGNHRFDCGNGYGQVRWRGGGATVTIQNVDKNDVVVRVLTTNSSGQFVGPYLPIGHYTLRAEAPGFKTTERPASH